MDDKAVRRIIGTTQEAIRSTRYRTYFMFIFRDLFVYSKNLCNFAAENKKITIMTAIELRAELFREMNPLLDNESAMTKMLAFVKSLVPAKKGIKRITSNERLDAALAKFSGDFGGNKDAMEIAQELRQGADMVREVETW